MLDSQMVGKIKFNSQIFWKFGGWVLNFRKSRWYLVSNVGKNLLLFSNFLKNRYLVTQFMEKWCWILKYLEKLVFGSYKLRKCGVWLLIIWKNWCLSLRYNETFLFDTQIFILLPNFGKMMSYFSNIWKMRCFSLKY